MLTALILICSLATISNDCARDNTLDVVYVPATFDSPAAEIEKARVHVVVVECPVKRVGELVKDWL